MPQIPPLNGNEVLIILLKGGFYIHHQRGSHARLFHRQHAELRVTIPIHKTALPKRTFYSILKQADLSEEEFIELRNK
jgi:predicted RNA binding protein YcfA (HicA-like mRNA interferase family)